MSNFRIRGAYGHSAFALEIRWKKIKELVLGKNYELSVVLVNESEMRRVEKLSRHKKHANVLSFAYSETSGEILLNVPFARKEAKKAGQSVKERLAYLYIHSILHLRGHDHKTQKETIRMEKMESEFMHKFGF